MFGSLFNSLGMIPDILMGKDPKKALTDNVAGVGTVLGLPMVAAAAAPASVPAAGSSTPGFMGQALGALDKYSKPIGVAATVAQVGQGLLSQPQMQAPQLQPRPGVDMSGLLSPQDWQQKSLARKQQQMAQMGLLGGGYGRIG